jgi:anti-sigma factor RsiW
MNELVDGELSMRRAEALERHLAGCECCAEFAADLRRAIAACRRLGRNPLPRSVQARARQRVRDLLATHSRA